MLPIAVQTFPTTSGVPEEYFLAPEKLVSGNPKQSLWTHYADPSGKFFAGLWQSEVGKWRIAYTEEEYCQVLQGRSILTDALGNAVTVSAGESFVIPRGFVGTWEVLEPTRKIFVIYESGEPLGA
jgi:uncharacterized cupin superfamily protein